MIPFGSLVRVSLRNGRDLFGVLEANPAGYYVLATDRGPVIFSRSLVGFIKSLPGPAGTDFLGGDLSDLRGVRVGVTVGGGFGTVYGVLEDVWPGREGVDLRMESGELYHVPLAGGAAVEALP